MPANMECFVVEETLGDSRGGAQVVDKIRSENCGNSLDYSRSLKARSCVRVATRLPEQASG